MTAEPWRWTESGWRDPDIDARDAGVISAGVDVGSVSSQAVIMADGRLCAYSNTRTGHDSPRSARRALDLALADTGLQPEDLHAVVGTGYGRVNVPFARQVITEIACHARGANFLFGPSVRTVLDVGGQDCKAIHCDARGKVSAFLMNDKCAAGTGRGMEVMADLVELSIEELGGASLEVDEEPPPLSSGCVVFARRQAATLLREGWNRNRVLAAYCAAMANRVCELIERTGIERELAITGGIAKNAGVVKRIEARLGVEALTCATDPQIAGAVGAALFGRALHLEAGHEP